MPLRGPEASAGRGIQIPPRYQSSLQRVAITDRGSATPYYCRICPACYCGKGLLEA